MTENNNNDASLDLLGGIPTSGRFFGFSSKFDLARQNTRIFTTADTLGKMAAELDDQYCSKKYIVSENIVYPLTGKIGIETVLQQFVQMAIFDGLTGNGKDDFTKPKGPAQMSEGLQFTTTLNLSATPKVVFAPATHDLHVLDASFTAQAIRADLHTLTIGLYVPKAGEPRGYSRGCLQAKGGGFFIRVRAASLDADLLGRRGGRPRRRQSGARAQAFPGPSGRPAVRRKNGQGSDRAINRQEDGIERPRRRAKADAGKGRPEREKKDAGQGPHSFAKANS